MNKIFLPLFASVMVSWPLAAGNAMPDPSPSAASHNEDKNRGHSHKHSKYKDKSAEELAVICEKEMKEVKDSLPADLDTMSKAEIEDYHLKIVALEVEVLKKPDHQDIRKHLSSCRYHLKAANKIIKRHRHAAEKHAKQEARKKRDEERKAKRDLAKAEKHKAQAEHASPAGGRDFGQLKNEDKRTAGSDVGVSAADAQKKDEDNG